ncbi:MAG: ABC transporter permease [Deltaproteobacteria bacterium]|nr:ABC transporter permease [Deltaproteobacteria bacterium]
MSALAAGVRKVGAYAWFTVDCVRATVTHGVPWDRVMSESYKVGIRSFPVLFTMALFVGSNLAIQGHAAFSTLGGGNLVGMFVALAGVREVCPLLAATMVAAKAGTEMAAQLAVMRTKEQIDAIEVMAIDPRSELVAPSIIAVMLTLPALTVLTIAVSLISSMLVAVYQLGVDRGEYLSFLVGYLTAYDLFAATAKSVVFGLIIATVSGYFGFFSERGARGVGQATNRAVVTMCIVIITLNFALTSILYG